MIDLGRPIIGLVVPAEELEIINADLAELADLADVADLAGLADLAGGSVRGDRPQESEV